MGLQYKCRGKGSYDMTNCTKQQNSTLKSSFQLEPKSKLIKIDNQQIEPFYMKWYRSSNPIEMCEGF